MVIEIGQIIQDFAVIMIVASVMALISYKLKQPLVIGYIIAGIIIGPHTPPFSLILHPDILNLFAEIGVILLLFVVGMEFPIEKLKNIGKKALIIAMTEAFGTFTIGFVVAQSLHYSVYNSLFLALAISVTSTVIVMRILEELDLIKHEASSIILGVAIIEDIIVISMLAILQSVGSTGHVSSSSSLLFPNRAVSVGTVLALHCRVLILGSKTIPRFVNYIGKNKPT